MIEVKALWNPTWIHGELAVVDNDVEATIREAVRQLAFSNSAVSVYRDIKYYVRTQFDGTKVVYFELIR